MDLSALGAVAGGLNQGWSMAQQDQELQRNRQLQDESQAFMQAQRQQVLDKQTRDETQAAEMKAASAPTKKVKQMTTDATGAQVEQEVDVPRSRGEILDAQASAFENARDYGTAQKMREQRYAWDKDMASKRHLAASQAGAGAKTAYDFVNAVHPMVNDDESPIGIRSIKPKVDTLGNATGGVELEVYNKNLGYKQTLSFDDLQSAKDALTAHYNPELFSDQVKRRTMREDKVFEKQAEGVNLKPGEIQYGYTADGRLVPMAENANESSAEKAARIRVGGSSASAGTGGGKEVDPMKAYIDAFKLSATEGDTKLTPDQMRLGLSYLPALAGQKVDAQTAQLIAQDAAINPTKTRLEINHQTGTIDRVYRNNDINGGNAIVLSGNAGSIKDMEKQNGGPEQMRAAVAGMVNNMTASIPEAQRAAEQAKLVRVATDPATRKAYLEAASSAGKDVSAISRKLDMIAAYNKPAAGAAPAPAQANGNAAPTIVTPGGMRRPDPLEGKGMQQIREIKAGLEKEKARYMSKGQQVPAGPRIKEIDALIERINNGQY